MELLTWSITTTSKKSQDWKVNKWTSSWPMCLSQTVCLRANVNTCVPLPTRQVVGSRAVHRPQGHYDYDSDVGNLERAHLLHHARLLCLCTCTDWQHAAAAAGQLQSNTLQLQLASYFAAAAGQLLCHVVHVLLCQPLPACLLVVNDWWVCVCVPACTQMEVVRPSPLCDVHPHLQSAPRGHVRFFNDMDASSMIWIPALRTSPDDYHHDLVLTHCPGHVRTTSFTSFTARPTHTSLWVQGPPSLQGRTDRRKVLVRSVGIISWSHTRHCKVLIKMLVCMPRNAHNQAAYQVESGKLANQSIIPIHQLLPTTHTLIHVLSYIQVYSHNMRVMYSESITLPNHDLWLGHFHIAPSWTCSTYHFCPLCWQHIHTYL